MVNNTNKLVCKGGFYLCWLMIISIAVIYASSTTEPWKNKAFDTIPVPNVDPLIYVDTQFYSLPQQMYNYRYKHVPPNEHLITKSNNFYSGIGSSAYYRTFYRPDFEQYPTQTVLILFFRIATFVGLIVFLFLLARMFQSGYTGDPFIGANTYRLFYMGVILLTLAVLRTAHSIALAGFIRLDPKLLGYDVAPSYTKLWIILPGVLLITGSFFFQKLIQLYNEQKLTV